jgi:hypothetical protein
MPKRSTVFRRRTFGCALGAFLLAALINAAHAHEKVLRDWCRDVETLVKDSAVNQHDPSHIVLDHLGYKVRNGDYNAPARIRRSIRTQLLEAPRHGRLIPPERKEYNFWTYAGEQGYTGKDRAVFLVTAAGKRFKVVSDYLVHEVAPESNPPACEKVFPRRARHRG